MSSIDISLLAIEVRKWDLEAQKIHLTSFYVVKNEEGSIPFEVGILQPPEMVEEFLGKLRHEVSLVYQRKLEKDEEELEVGFDNETFLRQKTYNYFKRITSELNATRKKKGQPKMIFTTHMDVYNETQDVTFLPKKLQFFVVLNWVRKYYDREDYKKAVEPLRKLIKVDPEFGMGYKWLARSLKKIRKYDEAMKFYEKYAHVDDSVDAWLDLAKSYRKGKLFAESKEIYQKLLKKDAKNKEAQIGMAQIQYATEDKKFIKILEKLNKEDSEWLKEWLTEEFNFRIYVDEKTPLSPVQAAKYLGFNKIFELTQRAFKNEIPSHFNPSRARLSFFKEELENWALVMNKFKCLDEKIELFPDKINQPDEELDAQTESANGQKTKAEAASGKPRTKVEELLMQIRARKAEREAELAEQKELADEGSKKKKPHVQKNGNQLSLLGDAESPKAVVKKKNTQRRKPAAKKANPAQKKPTTANRRKKKVAVSE